MPLCSSRLPIPRWSKYFLANSEGSSASSSSMTQISAVVSRSICSLSSRSLAFSARLVRWVTFCRLRPILMLAYQLPDAPPPPDPPPPNPPNPPPPNPPLLQPPPPKNQPGLPKNWPPPDSVLTSL